MNRYCVVGNPVEHSKSPIIHKQFAEQTGKHISYDKVLIEAERFTESMDALFDSGLNGCNVTVPFKETVECYCQTTSERATLAGAVNTLIRDKDGKIHGDNTDGIGLVRDIVNNNALALEGRTVLLAGAGGAARGIIQPLLAQKLRSFVICNRTFSKAEQLCALFSSYGPITARQYGDVEGLSFDLIINATSTSLSGDIPPIPNTCVGPNTTLYDLMYAKEPTPFLRWGAEQEAKNCLDGIGMLVEQAAESFYLWEGVRPDTRTVIAELQKM